jgi:uncharacterized protein YbjT (DUF2867 family)
MITILGATGNVGRKIKDILIKKGEKVRLISRSADKVRPIVGPNAQAFVGDAKDAEFLATALKDSDAVFTLLPPNFTAEKFMSHADAIGESIARALQLAKVKYVVNLSSLGAELAEGTGPVVGLHNLEERLNRIEGLNVLHLRCADFMENLLMNIGLIKSRGIMGRPVRGDIKLPMIATKDIASVAADRLLKRDFSGSSIQVLLGQRDLSMTEAASIIGRKIKKPDVTYVMLSYEDAEKGFVTAGLSPDMSRLYVEMNKAYNEGRIAGTTIKRTSENTTPTSLEEFCDEFFVPIYSHKKAA